MADVMSWPAARRETVDRFFMLALARAVAQADECTFEVEDVVRQGARVVRHPSLLGRSDPRPRSEYAPAR